jgi:LmbE family N-acetylglucosaminyl deacetylase
VDPVTGWRGAALDGERVVVVAPHPDDEVLAAGGLMRWMACRGREVVVVGVTDGEASHARSGRVTPDQLRARRAIERTDALGALGLGPCTVVRIGAPDSGCADHVGEIADAVQDVLRDGDLVVGPSAADRHPDHVAVAAAVARAVAALGTVGWEAPTWALVHGTAPAPQRALDLDDVAWAAKRRAIGAFRSQLEALGPHPDDGPVVHPHELVAMLRRTEVFTSGEP